MCKTRLSITTISLYLKGLIATAESFSLVCRKQIGYNEKHNSRIKETITSVRILFCKILKSLSRLTTAVSESLLINFFC